MTDVTRLHLAALLGGPALASVEKCVEKWRRAWDPGMAAVVPPHVTLGHRRPRRPGLGR